MIKLWFSKTYLEIIVVNVLIAAPLLSVTPPQTLVDVAVAVAAAVHLRKHLLLEFGLETNCCVSIDGLERAVCGQPDVSASQITREDRLAEVALKRLGEREHLQGDAHALRPRLAAEAERVLNVRIEVVCGRRELDCVQRPATAVHLRYVLVLVEQTVEEKLGLQCEAPHASHGRVLTFYVSFSAQLRRFLQNLERIWLTSPNLRQELIIRAFVVVVVARASQVAKAAREILRTWNC